MESVIEVFVARDWTGVHIFNSEPITLNCGGTGIIWSGYRNKALETPEIIEKYKNMSGKEYKKIQFKIKID